MEQFLDHIQAALHSNKLFKLTLSKPRAKKAELRNVFIRPVKAGETMYWQATLRFNTKDQTKNYESDLLLEQVESFLKDHFFNADLFLKDRKITLLQSKKGSFKVLVKNETSEIKVEEHDHQKKRLIPASSTYLNDLGISSSNGKIYAHAQDKFKQINRYVELVSALIKEDDSLKTIYDMGSGKGYLTFGLHDYLSRNKKAIKTTGVEIRPDLIDKCNRIARANHLDGLSFELGSIDDFNIEKADMVIALHACDIATDMAIAKGIEADAKYIVVAPCCHKQIRKAMKTTKSHLNPLLRFGILKERQAEMITDTIRALILESQGYQVNIFEFISSEHTGKNIMLTAVKNGQRNDESLEKVEQLKKEFGIAFHYLEKLVF